jgi:hypothetical protein
MPSNAVADVRKILIALRTLAFFSMSTEIRDRNRGGDGKEGTKPQL